MYNKSLYISGKTAYFVVVGNNLKNQEINFAKRIFFCRTSLSHGPGFHPLLERYNVMRLIMLS